MSSFSERWILACTLDVQIIKIILNTLQATVRSRLAEFQEENNSLRSKISVLEVASYGATEQEKLIGKTLFHSTLK